MLRKGQECLSKWTFMIFSERRRVFSLYLSLRQSVTWMKFYSLHIFCISKIQFLENYGYRTIQSCQFKVAQFKADNSKLPNSKPRQFKVKTIQSRDNSKSDNSKLGQFKVGTIQSWDNSKSGQFKVGTIQSQDNSKSGQFKIETIQDKIHHSSHLQVTKII